MSANVILSAIAPAVNAAIDTTHHLNFNYNISVSNLIEALAICAALFVGSRATKSSDKAIEASTRPYIAVTLKDINKYDKRLVGKINFKNYGQSSGNILDIKTDSKILDRRTKDVFDFNQLQSANLLPGQSINFDIAMNADIKIAKVIIEYESTTKRYEEIYTLNTALYLLGTEDDLESTVHNEFERLRGDFTARSLNTTRRWH